MVEKLLEAGSNVFTVTFRKKVNVDKVLEECKSDSWIFKNKEKLANNLANGELHTISGFLTNSDEKLGRSSVIDLDQEYGKAYRLVDHRTIETLILDNVKYVLK